jgi:glycosyltransferase involved in cell wall biosynthesis
VRLLRELGSIAADRCRRNGKDDIGRNLRRFRARLRTSSCARPSHYEEATEIIIPSYNHATYLEEAFESIVAQTWQEYPIAVTLCDDNSSDSTPALIRGLKENAPDRLRVRTLRNEINLRQWGSLNRAIRSSQSELIIVLNADDVLVPDALEKIFFAFESHPELAMVGGSSIWFSATKRPAHVQRPAAELPLTIYVPEGTARYKELNDLNMTQSSCSFFRFAWEGVGGYWPRGKRVHSRACEDRDFQMRVNTLFPVGVFTDYPLAYYRTDSSHGHEF